MNYLKIERAEDIAVIMLNRPEKHNALSPELLGELEETMRNLAPDDTIRVLVLKGAGKKAFSAGFDLDSLVKEDDNEFDPKRPDPLETALQSVSEFPCPTIAMLRGVTFGAGFDLALCCDFRVAASDIRISIPAAKRGLVYPPASIHRMIRTLGLQTTRKILFFGEVWEGKRALEKGLIDHLVQSEELEPFTLHLAGRLAANAPLAVRGMKGIIGMQTAASHPDETVLWKAEKSMHKARHSNDFQEAMQALKKKRPPYFKGI